MESSAVLFCGFKIKPEKDFKNVLIYITPSITSAEKYQWSFEDISLEKDHFRKYQIWVLHGLLNKSQN